MKAIATVGFSAHGWANEPVNELKKFMQGSSWGNLAASTKRVHAAAILRTCFRQRLADLLNVRGTGCAKLVDNN